MADNGNTTFTLVTFATDDFLQAQQGLTASARALSGFRESIEWNRKLLEAAGFCADYPELRNKPGAGYWMWKPFILLSALKDPHSSSEWCIYYDVGRGSGNRIGRDIDPLTLWADKANGGIMPGVLIPEFGPTAWWTRRDTFVGMECDEANYHSLPQVQATYCLFRRSDKAIDFVQKWWDYSRQIALIGEGEQALNLENLPGFICHRHDQSILTLLCAREGVAAFGSPNQRLELSKSMDSAIAMAAGEISYRFLPASRRILSRLLRRIPVLRGWINRKRPIIPMLRTLAERGYYP